MKTTVETLEDFQKKLTIEIDAAEVDERINKKYKDFAYRYNFPGFRRGKAPRPVIDNMLGAQAVTGTVTDDIYNEAFPLAMDEHDLISMGQPVFADDETLVKQGEPFTFEVTVACRPEFELSDYGPVKVTLPSAEASEEEINDQVDELRNYYYTFEDKPANTKVKAGSYVDLGMTAADAKGTPIVTLSTESRLYEMGSGLFPEDFDANLMGMKKGESKSFTVDMSQPCLMGNNLPDAGPTTFDVDVKQVKEKKLPELTDEWCKETAGFESVAELRERVADNVKQQKEQFIPRLRENEALYALQERLQGEAPEALCEAEEQNLLQTFFMQMQQSGLSFDQYLVQNGMTSETFADDLKQQAADVVTQDLALDAWARHADIQITDEEISEEFVKSGAEDPEELEAEWRSSGRMAMLRAGMRRSKAIEQILETLEVTELAPGEKMPERKPKDDKKGAKKDAKKGSKKAASKAADDKSSAEAEAEKADE